MIDEDLYQQAADELNSDRRRQHIWARACALASDDHDEARYLYTNLRVEELIAQRDAAGASGSGGQHAADAEIAFDKTLALEPTDIDIGDSEDSGNNDDIPASVSAPSGIDRTGTSSGEDALQLAPADSDPQDSEEFPDRVSFEDQFEQGLARNGDDFQASLSDEELTELDNKFDRTLGSLPTLNRLANQGAESDALAESLANQLANGDSDNINFDEIQNDLRSELGAQFDEELDRDLTEEPKTVSLSTTLDDTLDELDGTAVLDFDGDELAEFDTLTDSAPDEDDVLQQNTEQLDELLSGVSTRLQDATGEFNASAAEHPLAEFDDDSDSVLTADFSDASGTQQPLDRNDMDWLAENTASNDLSNELKPLTPAEKMKASVQADLDHAQRLNDELERQADELPGQRSDILTHEDTAQSREDNEPATVHDVTDSENRADVTPAGATAAAASAAAASIATAGATAAARATNDNTAGRAGAAAQHVTEHDLPVEQFPDLPVDVSDTQSGTRYAVYLLGNKAQAVKTGVSWSALLMTIPFLIYRHLFGTAIVYTLLAFIVLGGLLVTGLAWLDAGDAATTLIKASTAGFAFLAVVGLLYLPFRHGNTWRGEKLERRGYELVAWVRAKNPGMAISEARRAAALD